MFRFTVVDKYSFLFGVLKSTVLCFFALLVRELKRKVPFQNLHGAGLYNVYIILLHPICQV